MASSKELELAVKIAGKLDASYGNALSSETGQCLEQDRAESSPNRHRRVFGRRHGDRSSNCG